MKPCVLTLEDVQIRAPDTDVDNSVDWLASVSLPRSAADLFRELLHMLKHGIDILNHALPIDLHRPILSVAQRNMVDSSLLCKVDLLALEHIIAKFLKLGLTRQLRQKLERVVGDEVLAEVEEGIGLVGFIVEGARELLKALGILLEGFFEDYTTAQLLVVILELFPSGEVGSLREAWHFVGVCYVH